jgi:hypothetical protein
MPKFEVVDSNDTVTITLDGDSGDVIIVDGSGKERVRIHAADGSLQVTDAAGQPSGSLSGDLALLWLGGASRPGYVQLASSTGETAISLDGNQSQVRIGATKQPAKLVLYDGAGKDRILLDGGEGALYLEGDLFAKKKVYALNSTGNGTIILDGLAGDLTVGGFGQNGTVIVKHHTNKQRLGFDSNAATLAVGGGEQSGQISIVEGGGKETINLHAGTANLSLGGAMQQGDVIVKNGNGQETVRLSGGGLISAGGGNQAGKIVAKNTSNVETIRLEGNKGDIALKGDIKLDKADCAEEFDISEVSEAEPGTVMVLDRNGKLEPSRSAYDKRVAGVISGAGELKPGIILDRQEHRSDRMPVALLGKVYCRVDAQYSPIETGDLLTTSPTPGHAMKASDPLRAFGAVIGKALRALADGQGLIPILIALQ